MRILREYSQIEVVQIQFNYLDYNDPAVQSRQCYEVCQKLKSKLSFLKRMKNDKRQVLDLEEESSYNVHEGRKTSAGLEA